MKSNQDGNILKFIETLQRRPLLLFQNNWVPAYLLFLNERSGNASLLFNPYDNKYIDI